MSNLTSTDYIRGALYGLAAASIWAGWIVVARLGVTTSLTPWDIAALRFGVGGLLLLPYLLRKGFAIERLGWIRLAAIVLGCGAPMVLLVNAGLLFAPAAHAGGLFSGGVPLIVALLAVPVLHEALAPAKRIGLALNSGRRHRCRLGCGRHDRHATEHRPRSVSRRRLFPGPVTRSRCDMRVSTASTPPPLPLSVRSSSICLSTPPFAVRACLRYRWQT